MVRTAKAAVTEFQKEAAAMHYTEAELKQMRGAFVCEFLQSCSAAELPLDAEAALDYAGRGVSVTWALNDYESNL